MSAGSAAWTFTWKAPATFTAANNPITFYFATLAANGNGGTSGDNVLKASKAVRFKATTSSKDIQNALAVNLFPNPTKDVLNIDLADSQNAQLTLVDMYGKILLIKILAEKTNKINIAHLSKGLYNAQIQVGEKSISKKFAVN